MSRNEGKAGGGVSAFKPAFETGYFQFANFSPIFQCVKCDKIRMTQPWKLVCFKHHALKCVISWFRHG